MAIFRFPSAVAKNPQVGIVNMGNKVIAGSKSAPLIHHVFTHELGLSARLYPTIPQAESAFEKALPRLVVLSGGAQSVYNPDAPHISDRLVQI